MQPSAESVNSEEDVEALVRVRAGCEIEQVEKGVGDALVPVGSVADEYVVAVWRRQFLAVVDDGGGSKRDQFPRAIFLREQDGSAEAGGVGLTTEEADGGVFGMRVQ